MDNLESKLSIKVINLESRIQKQIGSALSVHGIGLTEYLVLHQLASTTNQKMRRRDLAEQIGLTPSGITRLLLPMEKIGLVAKEDNPRDARVSLIKISKEGKQVYMDAVVAFEHASKDIFKHLHHRELKTIYDLLQNLTS